MADYELENVLPRLTQNNEPNMLKGNTEFFSEFSMRNSTGGIQFSNLHNIFSGKFASAVPFANISKSVSNFISLIVCSSSPHKIFKSVVCFVSVYMTTLLSNRTWINEGAKD